MFSSVLTGGAIDVVAARGAGRRIADNIAEDGLSNWLETVRRHHEGTYQHCLLVMGVAVDFGLSLGLAKADIERLHTAAMFHDIGKAKIPLAVLDKPGRLDPQERALIETHPAAGYDVLKGTSGISPEVLDAVRHHHEYLDGSGYPDALSAESISDIVRMMTIADIFAALIESRSYKPGMPRGTGLRDHAQHARQAGSPASGGIQGCRIDPLIAASDLNRPDTARSKIRETEPCRRAPVRRSSA